MMEFTNEEVTVHGLQQIKFLRNLQNIQHN